MFMRLRINAFVTFRNSLLFTLLISIISCAPNSDVNEPVKLLWDKQVEKTDGLIVFLPGLYDSADDIRKEKMFSIARNAGIKADMVAASIHADHLLEEKLVERIEKDIFYPIKNQGYKNIWFVGISLGGLNSLLYYRHRSKDICGVVILAPYLANKALTKDLLQAGSIENWQPKPVLHKNVIDQVLQFLWVWIKEQHLKNTLTNIFIGYGDKDPYVEADKFLVSILDKKNVTEIEGKHNWKTGRKLWQQQLQSREKTGLLQPCK
jgi:hypothetical protein